MLREILQESSFLIHADPKTPFSLETDASDVGCKKETEIYGQFNSPARDFLRHRKDTLLLN
jgi:hypothetical protein